MEEKQNHFLLFFWRPIQSKEEITILFWLSVARGNESRRQRSARPRRARPSSRSGSSIEREEAR